MKYKHKVFACFKVFRAFFEKDGCHTIKSLRTNNGGKYVSKEFELYLSQSGIKHKPGPLHSPELNGMAKQTNFTISNTVQAALLDAHLPKSFWMDVLCHSFFAYNSFPCNSPLGFKTPVLILGETPVDLCYLHPFGCLVYYKVPKVRLQTGRVWAGKLCPNLPRLTCQGGAGSVKNHKITPKPVPALGRGGLGLVWGWSQVSPQKSNTCI
jgi:transposase InsO family protein